MTYRVPLLLLLSAAAGPAAAQGDLGLFVAVPSPLTDDAVTRIKNRIETARGKPDGRPAKVVFDFTPADKDATTAAFGPCYELAKYAGQLHDLTTVAFVRKKLTGHLVLPALTCKELVLGAGAALGDAAPAGENLDALVRSGYPLLLGPARPAYVGVAKKMLDPNVQLRRATKDKATWYVDLRDRATLEKEGVVFTDTAPLGFAPDGRNLLLDTRSAKEIGLCRVTAESLAELAELFGLNPASLRADPLNGRQPVAFRYILRGRIDNGAREAVGRMVKEVIRQKGNLLVLQLECGGGDMAAAVQLANDLRGFETGDDPILIVGFVPDKAPDTATVVAVGCSEIIMSRRTDAPAGGDGPPQADIGDFEAFLTQKGANADGLAASLKPLLEAQGYSPVLADAMVNRELTVYRVEGAVNRTQRRLITADELEANKGQWKVLGSPVKVKGEYLRLFATQAEDVGLARGTVATRDVAEVFARYGVDPAKVRDATPAWLDRLASFLRLPSVTVLLVVIGFTGLILELKVPGTTVPGIVAALCFILVFWAHTQFSGQVAVLAGLLFALGLVLVLLEVFVLPGVGACGIAGVLCMLAALGLVTLNDIPATSAGWLAFGGRVAQYLIGMMVAVALAFVLARFLPNIPYANKLMLAPPDESAAAAEPLPGVAQAAGLLGAVGTAVTVLRPAGTVRFADAFVDVVTDGGYIPAGSRVQVIEVEANRIVVKEV